MSSIRQKLGSNAAIRRAEKALIAATYGDSKDIARAVRSLRTNRAWKLKDAAAELAALNR